MDLKFCGILDIILVLAIIVSLIIGAKKGFLEKFISMGSWLMALILAFIFCSRLADLFIANNIIVGGIRENILTNIQNTEAFKSGATDPTKFFEELGFPNIIANLINNSVDMDATTIANNLADGISRMFMVVISFLILFFGILIGLLVLKLIVKLIRQATLVRVVDGILGVGLYGLLSIITIYVAFFVLSLLMQIPAFDALRNFMITDMQLNTDKFRLSKYFYENNILINFLKLFF